MLVLDQGKKVFVDAAWTSIDGASFQVAQANNPKFQRVFQTLQLPHRRKLDKGTMDPSESQKIAIEAMAAGLIIDWKGIQDPEGKDIPFSKEVAIVLLTQRPDIREHIQEFALELENFRAETVEAMGER